MRLLFVVKSLAFAGGAERVLADLSEGLADRGHEVIIATFDPPGLAPFFPFSPRLELVPLGVGNFDRRSSAAEVFHRAKVIRRRVRERRPDLVIGFMHSAFVPLAFALVGTNVPSVGSEHTVYGHYRGRPLERLLVNLAAAGLSAMTAISPAMRDGFPPLMRRKMHVIPNAVRMNPVRSADAAGGRIKTILSVGRLEREKDQGSLISAFSAISAASSDWRLRIVGEGSLRGALERQIDSLQLRDLVELKGAVSDVGPEYEAAQIFAIPSHYESFGLATAEALAHGLPVVGFADCAGTNELVADGVNGLLVDGANRVGAMADGLGRLVDSPELRVRLGRAGPRSVEQFSVAAVVAQWEDLMRRLSSPGSCAV